MKLSHFLNVHLSDMSDYGVSSKEATAEESEQYLVRLGYTVLVLRAANDDQSAVQTLRNPTQLPRFERREAGGADHLVQQGVPLVLARSLRGRLGGGDR